MILGMSGGDVSTPCDWVRGVWAELVSEVRGMIRGVLLKWHWYTVKVSRVIGESFVGYR